MYQFRINHNNSPCTKFSHWIFHMVTLLPTMISTPSILGLHKMKPWQWRFHHNNSGFVKEQTCSFLQFLHHFNHLQTYHLALVPYMLKVQAAFQPDVPYKSGNLQIWILTTAPSAAASTITPICLGETIQFIEVKRPNHILCLLTGCSATSPNFCLPPHYEGPPLEVNISLDMVNLNMINISSVNFHIGQHLEKYWNESQLKHLASIPSVPFGQLYPHLAKGFQHITPFSPENSTGDTDSICTLFSHT